ncbi:hypothetical protein BYT27DRAFT_7093182 [Phlegmacium glaucopus]|nr:hypothetical protein BYT27DRAFT_7093182 [Phlegmacium glaucopus]
MESLNLNTLANSLPNAQQNAEKELLNDFKAAALSITTLYRSSRKNSKRAYNAGYAAACQDLLNFIQQGVSASDVGQSPSGASHDVEGGGMTIGKVMDWTEARVDAIKAREEEEEEDEEREKDKERPAPSAVPSVVVAPKSEVRKPGAPHPHTHRPKDTTVSLPTTNSPGCQPSTQAPSEPPSPSPPPTHVPRSVTRKHRLPREAFQVTTQSTNVPPSSTTFHAEPFPSSPSSGTFPDTPRLIGTGVKRRHAVMMMLDSSSAPISFGDPSSVVSSPGGAGSMNAGAYMGSTGPNLGKRRTRSSRNLNQIQSQNQNINVIQVSPEPMDVEEDGRERKRAARR